MPDQSPSPWRIVFYRDSHGRSPIAEYLNALPVAEQAAAEETFRLLREFGVLLGMPHAKNIGGKRGHEIVLLYEGRFADLSLYERETFESAQDNGVPIEVSWKPLADFEVGAFLVPTGLLAFLREHPVQGT